RAHDLDVLQGPRRQPGRAAGGQHAVDRGDRPLDAQRRVRRQPDRRGIRSAGSGGAVRGRGAHRRAHGAPAASGGRDAVRHAALLSRGARMSDAITLYDAHGSPCARRVRAVLLEKGLAWTTRLLDLTRLEQKRPEYLALNPNGVVPTLVHGDRVLYESNVITENLDDVFPEPPLYPRHPWARAQAKMWQAFELAMAKEFRPLMYARV